MKISFHDQPTNTKDYVYIGLVIFMLQNLSKVIFILWPSFLDPYCPINPSSGLHCLYWLLSVLHGQEKAMRESRPGCLLLFYHCVLMVYEYIEAIKSLC